MVVCDGLTGLPDAVGRVWPWALVQTGAIHLLRNSFRYAARQDRDKIAKALRPVYTAATERWIVRWKAALNAFEITFEGRLAAARNWTPHNRVTPLTGHTRRGRADVLDVERRRCDQLRQRRCENISWGCRRIHGELATTGIKVAASTVWEILKEHGIDPAPQREHTTWAGFLRSQSGALLACDFFETRTLVGARLYVFAVIEHATRRIRILGATAHPTADWVVQLGRNLVMDLEDAGAKAKFLIHDRDAKYTAAFDAVLHDAGLRIVLTGIRIPRMNSIIERWIQTCRRELLDRTLIWNQHHLLHALREYEAFYNEHRPHRTLGQAAPLRPLPEPTTDPDQLTRLDIRRQDRLGATLHEYRNAA